MSATVRFINNLREFQPEADEDGVWRVPSGRTLQELVDQSGIDNSMWEYAITVNGKGVLRSYALEDDDEVVFISPFVGG
jgi:sulfur carrier protein ThiS